MRNRVCGQGQQVVECVGGPYDGLVLAISGRVPVTLAVRSAVARPESRDQSIVHVYLASWDMAQYDYIGQKVAPRGQEAAELVWCSGEV